VVDSTHPSTYMTGIAIIFLGGETRGLRLCTVQKQYHNIHTRRARKKLFFCLATAKLLLRLR
jgi:hypothetical protein